MRVLIVSQHFWPESFRINDIAQRLKAAGHEVVVLTGQPNYPGGIVFPGYRAASVGLEHWNGLPIQRVPLLPRGRPSALRLAGNYMSFIASAAIFGAWRLRGQRFDAVMVYATSPLLQSMAAIVIARLKRCAVVTWVQDLWPQSLQVTGYVKSPWLLAAVARVVRWTYARQTLVLVQSPAFVAPVRALAPACLPIIYFPNPGEHHAGGQAASPPALRLPPGFNVVFAGNLGTAQALDVVLDAAQQLRDLPDVRFVLVGSGQRGDWLTQQCQVRALDNVELPGRFEPQQMGPILAQAQALLVTLNADPTMAATVPSKVQSYLAAGRPIIAALDGEGARVVREAGAGITCAAGDATGLARAVRALHAMPAEERRRMGEAGRHWYHEHYDPAHLVPQLVGHLRDAVARHASLRQ